MMRFFLLSLFFSGVTAFAPSMHKSALSLSTQSASISPLFRNDNKVSSTARCALETAEMPDKLYFKKTKEAPKVLGGLKIGLRELVVVTGASSGLGLNCAVTLAKTGKYFVVMAVRDVEKAKRGKRARWEIHDDEVQLICSHPVETFCLSFFSCQGDGYARQFVRCHET